MEYDTIVVGGGIVGLATALRLLQARRGLRVVARKYWRTALGEFHRSFSKAAFVRALQRLVPEIEPADLRPGGAGIRAQACGVDGTLLDDSGLRTDGNIIHVCNAPSPAAAAALAIGDSIARQLTAKL